MFKNAENRKKKNDVVITRELNSNGIIIFPKAFHYKLFSKHWMCMIHLFTCDLCRSLRNPVISLTVHSTLKLYWFSNSIFPLTQHFPR